MAHLIPTSAIDRYTAAPPATTVASAVSLHENIRSLLGSGYETFLQGSYKNDTGVADINDVDVVAVRKNTRSGTFSGVVFDTRIPWTTIFDDIQNTLEANSAYKGKTERGDKCITVNTNFHADVVPAVKIDIEGNDPIAVFSFREGTERQNFPRIHYANNVGKQARTGDNYKATVRMFKRWTKNWFSGTKIAPSFYVECLLYGVPDNCFLPDKAWTFFAVAQHIIEKITRYTVVNSVAADKDILTSAEWDPDNFEKWKVQLERSVGKVALALQAKTEADARKYWREAFGE